MIKIIIEKGHPKKNWWGLSQLSMTFIVQLYSVSFSLDENWKKTYSAVRVLGESYSEYTK